MMDDPMIVRLFRERSEHAVRELAEKYEKGCHRIALNILGSPEDAEESVNDAYLAVWNTVPPQEPDPLRTYLYRIVRNIATAKYHHSAAQKRNSRYDVALEELEACLPSPDGVEESFSAGELTALLDRFLETLSPEDRVLFVRRYWYGDSVQELAAACRRKPNTVSARLGRLRQKLRLLLQKEGITL